MESCLESDVWICRIIRSNVVCGRLHLSRFKRDPYSVLLSTLLSTSIPDTIESLVLQIVRYKIRDGCPGKCFPCLNVMSESLCKLIDGNRVLVPEVCIHRFILILPLRLSLEPVLQSGDKLIVNHCAGVERLPNVQVDTIDCLMSCIRVIVCDVTAILVLDCIGYTCKF